jgi:hypothetical protein
MASQIVNTHDMTKGSRVVLVDVFTLAARGKMNALSPVYNGILTREHNLPEITPVSHKLPSRAPQGLPNQKAFTFVLHY